MRIWMLTNVSIGLFSIYCCYVNICRRIGLRVDGLRSYCNCDITFGGRLEGVESGDLFPRRCNVMDRVII